MSDNIFSVVLNTFVTLSVVGEADQVSMLILTYREDDTQGTSNQALTPALDWVSISLQKVSHPLSGM